MKTKTEKLKEEINRKCAFCRNIISEEQSAWEKDNALQLCDCELFKEFKKLEKRIENLKQKLKQK